MSKTRKRKSDVLEDIPEHIVKHRLNRKTLQTEFFIKWVGFGPKENTWEPVEHIFHCLELLQDYEKRKKAILKTTLKKTLPKADHSDLPMFKVLHKDILNNMNDPEEFIPQGNEDIRKISSEFPSEAGVPLWHVTFGNDVFPRAVRKSVMIYYWPVKSCSFLSKWVKKIEAYSHFEAQQSAGPAPDPE